MFRIMVVDDEASHLLSLIGVIRAIKPSYLIFNARDGVQAMQILSAFDADLLITDIKMPQMDGLTLIERAKALHPALHTVLLSGFGEFEFARRAIELGVDGYLLKPVDEQELMNMLDGFEWKVRMRQTNERNQQQLLQTVETMKMDRIEREIEMFALGFGDDVKPALSKLFHGAGGGLVLCMRPVGDAWSDERISEWKTQFRYFLKQFGEAIVFRSLHMSGAVIAIVAMDQPPSEAFYVQVQTELLHFIGGERDDARCVFGSSMYHAHLFEDIASALRQASEACEYTFFKPGRLMNVYHPDFAFEPFLKGSITLPLDETAQHLLDGDPERAADLIITNAMDYIVQYRPFPSKFKEVLMFCFWKLCTDAGAAIREDDLQIIVANMDHLISSSADWKQLQQVILSGCQLFCELHKNRRRTLNEDALSHAAALLRERYDENWTLDGIAERVHFNPTYFSSIFKQRFGMGYSDYLNEIRMEKAAELLRSGNLQIGRLAKVVGFHDATYFIRAFRKKYGMTPNEYRKADPS